MKNLNAITGFILSFFLATLCATVSCRSNGSRGGADRTPLFTNFIYEGQDPVYEKNPVTEGEFYIPILQGCYPDPSITRKGGNYYLVASSFAFFPGVPIFQSNDLINWKSIGHVLDRESQLKVYDIPMSAGIYAPDIQYNPHNDMFYMITTQFAGGFGNMVVKASDPAGDWSDPIKLDFEGIDPALFFDDDGKAYVVHNDAPEKGKELYEGHRVIKIWDYDVENDQVVQGSDQIIVDGGVDLSKKPIWIEAPHLYKKNGKYYLMCAEGGTGGNHSEVIFSGTHPKGPFKPAKKNPILSQRHLAKDRSDKVDWAGHADLVETSDGEYYGVFLAVRPNEKERVNTGRETFMLPVDWTGEFPAFVGGMAPLPTKLRSPKGATYQLNQEAWFLNGNFTYQDDFKDSVLNDRWIGVRGPRETFAKPSPKGLVIEPFATTIQEMKPTSTLFHRQQHNFFKASTLIHYKPGSEKDLAGLVCYQREGFHYVFGLTKQGKDYYIVLERTAEGKADVLASAKVDLEQPITLEVRAEGDAYQFHYGKDKEQLNSLGEVVSGDILSTDVAKGFTGALIGLYSTSGNEILPGKAD
ncbi:glycoside hydrolase family 43 protein [Olivibacter sp. SDN3]|uniref:glycoside hydrolase family 43 protein n=1 Tax=Olivibacter sp. SDN3 TaxID=2764720 RepID=UPI001651A465|nr:glycoside hydrolase family 43 protein [Olivibacter sp. SDN3]QNL47919.1 glycoside hydrolase family 43 protein [Olivibacter sp. SDN3]